MQKNQISNSTVSGEIIKILEKESKYGDIYFDIHFRLLKTGSFYRSCIYPYCRNFSNWTGLLSIGNVLSNLELIWKKGRLFIDADSIPLLIRKGKPEAKQDLKPVTKQVMKSFGVQEVLFQ